jgi:hypothetical protein
MYQASVGAYGRALSSLDKILTKAEAWAKEAGIDLADLAGARLAPDMNPLTSQIQLASDTSKLAVARLTGVSAPPFEDTETTFEELHARIARTLAFFATVDAKAFEGAESRQVVLNFPGRTLEFTGADFLTGFALPNFYFHVTTAYAILRAKGVPLGKADFLGG